MTLAPALSIGLFLTNAACPSSTIPDVELGDNGMRYIWNESLRISVAS